MAFPPRFSMPVGGGTNGSFAPPQFFVNPMRTQSAAAHSAAPSTSPQQAPITTVFVGNITEKCTNEFIQTMLDKCGRVSNWKRIQGSNGKFQAFGFCEFEHPEGTLRALRVLNEFGIADKKLVVKAEDKVRDLLCTFDAEARKRAGKEPLKLAPGKLPGDEEALKKDEEVRLDILNIIEKDFPELLTVEDGELSDKEKDKKDDKDRRRRSSVDRSRKDDDRRRRRSRSRSRSAKRSGRNSRRSRSPKHKRKRRGSSSSSSSDSDSRSSSSDSSSGSERAARRKKVKKSRSGSRGGDSEDSDDARERKALKRSMKEKEEHYMARLKKWEDRERSKSKQYDKEESRENQKKREIQKEAKKLKHFLEDYDDERDDGKYYKSSSLFQRKRDFEKEKEADAKDRQREAAEIEELKKQILAEGVTFTKGESVEELAKKRHEQQEEAAARKRRADSGSPNPHQPLGQNGQSSSSSEDDDDDDDKEKVLEEAKKELAWNSVGTASPASASPLVIKLEATSVNTGVASPAIKAEVASPKEQKIGIDQRLSGVFGMDDEEDELTRRKKLKPFEITKEERMQAMTHEERVKLTKQLIDSIPKGKEELFAYTLDWSFIDDKLVESRVRPWVAKKIREYIGEEEVSLVQFVCEKVSSKTPPLKILSDISMILDDEAEVFVVKMWRLLIYESEAKKQGLHPPKA